MPDSSSSHTGGVVQVGVGVLVLRAGRVLLGQRRGSHGAGTWALPGGHLEFNETVAACAIRETLEETGLDLRGVVRAAWTEDRFEAEGRHYVTLFVCCTDAVGTATVREPDKCAQWAWFEWSDLPVPLFAPLRSLVDSGYRPTQA